MTIVLLAGVACNENHGSSQYVGADTSMIKGFGFTEDDMTPCARSDIMVFGMELRPGGSDSLGALVNWNRESLREASTQSPLRGFVRIGFDLDASGLIGNAHVVDDLSAEAEAAILAPLLEADFYLPGCDGTEGIIRSIMTLIPIPEEP